MIDDFPTRFPTIWAACRTVGLDPTRDWLPVAPAAHYLSGGVVADLDGATTLPHLWACGETACSGVHGANRLASNSLLDGLVFGRRVVRGDRRRQGRRRSDRRDARRARAAGRRHRGAGRPGRARRRRRRCRDRALRGAVQRAMSADCGVVRDADGLRARRRDARRPRRRWPTAARARGSRRTRSCNLLRVVAGDRRRRDRTRGVARRAHAHRLSRCTDDRWLGRLVVQGDRRAAVRRAGRRSPPESRHERLRSAPVGRASRWWRPRWPRTSACSATSRRSRCVRDDEIGDGRVRRPGKRACSRAPRSSTRRSGRSTASRRARGTSHDGDPIEAGTELGEVSGPLRSILAGERVALNFLCHCSGVASLTRRYVRAARGKARILDTRKTLPGLRGGAARGRARGRRLQPPRLALDRGADQGQPPRRARHHAGGRARAGALADADHRGRVRDHRPGGRGARRRGRRRDARQHDARPGREGGGDPRGQRQGRGVGQHHARLGRRVRGDRRRLHLGRARSRIPCACSTSASTSNERGRPRSMLLAVDAGNTQTVVGLFRGHELVDHWRIATDADRTSDELALMVQQFLGFHGFSFARPGSTRASARRTSGGRSPASRSARACHA